MQIERYLLVYYLFFKSPMPNMLGDFYFWFSEKGAIFFYFMKKKSFYNAKSEINWAHSEVVGEQKSGSRINILGMSPSGFRGFGDF